MDVESERGARAYGKRGKQSNLGKGHATLWREKKREEEEEGGYDAAVG